MHGDDVKTKGASNGKFSLHVTFTSLLHARHRLRQSPQCSTDLRRLNRSIGFSHEIVPITVFFVLWSRKLYHWIKSRNKSDFPVVLGKLYTDIYNLLRFFVQDLCENTLQRPLKHQKCRFRRSIYIFYNNNFPQNKELLHKLEWFSVKVWMKF